MKEPIRWSHAESEVDPVMRSMLRYGRGISPDSGQMQSLLRRVRDAAPVVPPRQAQSRLLSLARRLGAAGVVGVVSLFGVAAWASYVVYSIQEEAPPTAHDSFASASASVAAIPIQRQQRENSTNSDVPEVPTPALPTASFEPVSAPTVPSARPSTHAPVAPPPQRISEDELLTDARHRLRSDPGRALELVREHSRSFPRGALGEERDAIEIEGLMRLGRKADASHRFLAFERRHPNSLYRGRLSRLVGPGD